MDRRLPKGPSAFVFVRSLFDLSYTLADIAREYGDLFTFPSPFGPVVVTCSPEGNKAIFSADPDTFAASSADVLSGIFDSSVLVTHGAQHRRQRKLLMPPFHGARMRAYGQLMRRLALEWAARVEPAKPFVMVELTQNITLDVIIEAVFGVEQSESLQAFRRQIQVVLGSFTPFALLKPLRRNFFGLSPWARMQRNLATIADMVTDLCQRRRATAADRQDILSLLLQAKDEDGNGLSDKEIYDQLLTIVFAGHETTAVMLAWAFYCLHGNPDALRALHAEIDPLDEQVDPETVARLPYLEAVLNETLRLYPPVHIIHRRLLKPLALGDYQLQPGDAVAAGTFATHRMASLYPEPDRFLPQRFIDRSYSAFEFLPWGGGARRCLGAAFAMYEMKLVLFALLKRYRFKLLETGPVGFVHRPGTVGPKGGIRMMIPG